MSAPCYPHIHMDIETLGVTPGSIVLSIGAVEVDLSLGRTGRQFYTNIDQADSEFYGLTIDPRTQRWWDNQSEAARARINDQSCMLPLVPALKSFNKFIEQVTEGKGSSFEISGGQLLDFAVLEEVYRIAKVDVPWPFWAVRHYATLREWFPDVKPPLKNKLHHCALNDAIYQAKHLIAIHQHINGTKPADDEL